MFGNRAIWADGWKAVTLHAKRMPWEVNVILPFEQDEWELYHVAEDFSESTNLAAQHPEKLAELQRIFDEEAWKHNTYRALSRCPHRDLARGDFPTPK